LAWQLQREGALQDFDPYPMILKAAAYLIRHGPVTEQERWEEASGYSPSTLASNIAALIGAAWFARDRGDEGVATMLEEYADFLECHIEAWTVTTEGSLVSGIQRHYIRILPEDVGNANPLEDPNSKVLKIKNHPAGSQDLFPAKDIVDAGFLQLARYGIRRPDDPLIVDSLKIIDAVLKVNTPVGLASLQSRWLRSARGRRPVRRVGQRSRVASSDRRTRAFRTLCRTRRETVHTSD
jgi:glucoamylase